MMSLDARRQLWSARTDPRRKGYAVGTYAHVMDQWGIIYNQPIILNKRQAGAAIEGALKQRIIDIDRVAEPKVLTDDVISKVAPIAHGHFNLRGMFNFDLGVHRSTLLEPIRNVVSPRAKPGS